MRRAACFCAGFLLALTAVLAGVLAPAVSTPLFERALMRTVEAAEVDLRAFAGQTMRYLRGEAKRWEPELGVPVSEAFHAHMAEVRAWIARAPWALGGGLAVAVALLLLGGRGRRACLGGAGALVLAVLLLLLWAAVDFDSMWMVLHRTLIPGGIFPAGEPVMRFFPLSLFVQYLGPVCLSAAAHLAAACGLILALTRKGRCV